MIVTGFFTPWIVYAVITGLHVILPGKWIKGYVKHDKTGGTLSCRLNGILVLAVSVLAWAVLGFSIRFPLIGCTGSGGQVLRAPSR
jgi:hypothetical protein